MKGIVFDEGGLERRGDLPRCATCGPTRCGSASRPPGVCHSDVSVIDGTIPFPTPVVLGHEGAGIVSRRSAPRSAGVAVGDHVVLTTLGNCGQCAAVRPRPADPLPRVVRQAAGAVHRGRATPRCFQFANIGVFCRAHRRQGHARRSRSARTCRCEVGIAHRLRRLTGVGAVFNRAKVNHGQSRRWSSASAASAST